VEAVQSTGRSPWTARKIVAIDGEPPENARNVPPFERGTVIDPIEWLKLETGKEPIGTRFVDLFCPIGKGTRGMIVAPPRSGKTVLLKQIAQAIVKNHPECKLIVVLVDERPEEVTDFKRSIPEAEVWASSNDESIQSHLDMARLVINRSKRMVERGQHVVMLLDSITRLARAFNAAGEGAKGRTMSGGMAAGAMQEPRAIFGASRCLEEGGSLTIIATALVETGSAMDELIFQEFKGTGNMELVLDRKLAEKRLFPAIDISASGTRKDEKLQDPAVHKRVGIIRRYLSGMDMVTGMTRLLEVMDKTDSNADLLKKFEP
jgi:transcription termination factor Rho